MGQKKSCVQNTTKLNGTYDYESSKERAVSLSSPLGGDAKEIKHLIKVNKMFLIYYLFCHKIIWLIRKFKLQELEERDHKLKQQEDIRKQLILKLCNAQKQVENSEQKLKKIEGEHQKAIRAIQGFMEREQQLRDTDSHTERQNVELETELCKGRNNSPVSLKDLGVKNADDFENDSCKQVNIAIHL